MNEKEIQKIFKWAKETGYFIMLEGPTDDFLFKLALGHKSWVTTDLYKARTIPYWQGNNLEDLFERMSQYIRSRERKAK